MIKVKFCPFFFLILLGLSLNASYSMPTVNMTSPVMEIKTVDLFSNKPVLAVAHSSARKHFEIDGTLFNYDEIFNNKQRRLYWHCRTDSNRSCDLYDLSTSKRIEPLNRQS